ncbi:MAG: polymerase subunit alpha, partial [Cryptosporangiaceae bacterium]|nr:polymerase subunit alpha [Cryptosporangiaceae bacterium]
LWDILVPFSDYAFNRAHTAGYGLVSFWTAYLKANYPAEYMAALLTSVRDDKDKSAVYLNECRRMGIKVLPPDVNESADDFTPVGTDIRFGLTAIRNVGANVVTSVVTTRTEKGQFDNFYDFLRKVEAVVCNKKTVESLIKAGAFDSLGHSRRGLLAVHADAIEAFMDTKRNEAIGQFDLFGSAFGDDGPGVEITVTPTIPEGEWEKADLLAFEREMLGLYVSDHPLFGVEHLLSARADHTVAGLSDEGITDGKVVTVAGILSGVTRKVTKQGKSWALASLEDLEGAVEVLFFPNTYELVGQYLAEDAVVAVKGRVDKRDDVPRVMAMDLQILDVAAADSPRGPVIVAVPAPRCTPPMVERLREVLTTHPGTTDVHLQLQNGAQATVWRLGDQVRVNPSPALMADLKALLGPSGVIG